jgi:hypothetical protein
VKKLGAPSDGFLRHPSPKRLCTLIAPDQGRSKAKGDTASLNIVVSAAATRDQRKFRTVAEALAYAGLSENLVGRSGLEPETR